MDKDKRLRCYCDQCNRETNHTVMYSTKQKSDDEDYWWQSTYSIVKCMGCDNIQFHKEDIDEDDVREDINGDLSYFPTISVFPIHQKKVDPIKDTWRLPGIVQTLYKETMDCLNNGALQLAAAGFRATIEAICQDNGIEGKTLETKINNMAKSHLITTADRDNLHAIRFIGNDSIHGIKKYSEAQVIIVAHIVNAILTTHYLIAHEVKDLDVKPISKYPEFEKFLLDLLDNQPSGKVDTLRNFVKNERRIIKEDLPGFETELHKRINEGKFVKLSLCAPPQTGRSQQYKVEATATVKV